MSHQQRHPDEALDSGQHDYYSPEDQRQYHYDYNGDEAYHDPQYNEHYDPHGGQQYYDDDPNAQQYYDDQQHNDQNANSVAQQFLARRAKGEAKENDAGKEKDKEKEKKKRPKDYCDDYKPHRHSDRIPAVELPKKIAELLLRDARLSSPGSAHRHCFTFFGFGERKTSHAVKKSKVVLVVLTYESFNVFDTDRGELLRTINLMDLCNPIYCVIQQRVLHLKVRGEHDFVITFVPPNPELVSHPVDILCDLISGLYSLMHEDELEPGQGPESLPVLDVAEVPTSNQLFQVNLKRPADYTYPSIRLKDLLRYENPKEEEEAIELSPRARIQIPDKIEDIPHRPETFVDELPESRVLELKRRLEILEVKKQNKLMELKEFTVTNNLFRNEVRLLNGTVSSLRTAVQKAFDEARKTEERRARRSVRQRQRKPSKAAAAKEMKWEKGSDEEEHNDQFQPQEGHEELEDEPVHIDGLEGDVEVGDEDEEEDEEGLPQSEGAACDAFELNEEILRESKKVFKKLKLVKIKLFLAREQAARMMERTDAASELIQKCKEALLRLEFVAREAAVREAGATNDKGALEVKNRALKLELQALKLLNRAVEPRDQRLVEAETELAKRERDLLHKTQNDEKLVEEELRTAAVEYERHLAEMEAFYDAEVARCVARTQIEFRDLHEKFRSTAVAKRDGPLYQRATDAVASKVRQETHETKLLREELQKKATHIALAIASMRDENIGIKQLLTDVFNEYGVAVESSKDLETRLLDCQRSLSDERDNRKQILAKTKDQIVTNTQATIRSKEGRIADARRQLYELQDSIQRAAKTFGLGGLPSASAGHHQRHLPASSLAAPRYR